MPSPSPPRPAASSAAGSETCSASAAAETQTCSASAETRAETRSETRPGPACSVAQKSGQAGSSETGSPETGRQACSRIEKTPEKIMRTDQLSAE